MAENTKNSPAKKETLQKILSAMGIVSRTGGEAMIKAGRVKVNGEIPPGLGFKAGADDIISVDGQIINIMPSKRYILLYKPAGYICSLKDEKGRRTVIDLLNGVKERVFPLGRLDCATSGLLLLSNDGEMMHALLHPSRKVKKTYLAATDSVLTAGQIYALSKGILLNGKLTAEAKIEPLKNAAGKSLLKITIHEGRNRQIRRMLEAIGHKTVFLRRIGFASLTLDGLRPGQWRDLSPAETAALKSLYQGENIESPPRKQERR
jgi:pseudouridine synthase